MVSSLTRERDDIIFCRPIGSQICYVQPKCDDDRIRIANDFIKATEYRVSLLIDPVSKIIHSVKCIVHGQFDFM
jgi:hypothetical protein